jgi:hypothetical protein
MAKELPGWMSWLVLIIGVLYLLQNYGVALAWWKVQWQTAAFLLLGLWYAFKL